MKTAEEILEKAMENSDEYCEITLNERRIILLAMREYADAVNIQLHLDKIELIREKCALQDKLDIAIKASWTEK